ncbi:TonB-dependent hemoglobin/transferrin/lactoferrin family receptor [Rhodoferax sp.]|uniref:TonB-dependent hemoglobin/transferrin/lactoferrin family receptor n=1 Tax=Rhodoferax sp. TaxID=50421 RepID=UPI002ACDE472|nr:TonB-dependent hemoglobin/transferrin/lactoferrin family receptor [Rhodoferax sp.]MDZ7892556.1 TonB-dependent hemoglobin/transferrin/lactoferrin family receptor [Rhodoferax sp.]MDZ7918596.1 TonB-dependent hemoglobin/transferrin/lactoferrin family receptor [Rhodoferax sp.]
MARIRRSGQFSLTRLSLCLGLAFGSGGLWAQEVPVAVRPVATLKEVVVSASRVEQELEDVPATLTVITAEDIALDNPTDLEELLGNEVGVSVRSQPNRSSGVFYATGRSGNEGVNIRGLEGDQVRLQVDGVSLPSTYASGPYAAGRGDTIDPEGYKRVEILRGGSSSQFGSDGLAGAVSFVTKEPEDLLTLGKPQQFTLKSAYASVDNSFQLAPSFAFAGEGVKGMVLASMRRSHETDNMGTNDSANNSRTTPNPANNQADYVLAKLVLSPSATHQVKLSAETIRRQNNTDIKSFFGDSFAAATLTDVDVREDISRDLVKLDYRFAPNGMWFDVMNVGVYAQQSKNQQYGYEARSTAPLVRNRDTGYGENTLGANLQIETNLGDRIKHRWVYGLDTSITDVTSLKEGYNSSGTAFVRNKSFPDTDYRVLGAFIQDEINFGAVSVTPGLRYDSFKLTPKPDALYRVNNSAAPSELSDSALSPRLGAVWKLAPMAQLFANYAHGFRAPKASQVNGGVTNLTAADPYTSTGNPNLKSETSDSVELGLQGHMAGTKNSYSVSVFHGKYKDFIASNVKVTDNAAPMADVYQSINLSKVTISGFEARANWALSKDWNLSAAYAHAEGDSESNGASTPLATIDPDKLILGLSYAHGAHWGLATQITAVERKLRNPDATKVTPGGYSLVDVSAWYNVSKATRLTAGINNLFDRKYVEWADVRDLAATSTTVDAYTQPGRNFKVSLTHSF